VLGIKSVKFVRINYFYVWFEVQITLERPIKFWIEHVGDIERPETIAKNLFSTLRKFDTLGVDIILSESFAYEKIGLAIMNRLQKAAGYNIIEV